MDTLAQTALQERVDLVLEAMIERLVESRSCSQASPRLENTVSTALTDAMLVELAMSPVLQPASAESQVSPWEAAMASMIAAALAPTTAEALASAVVKALKKMVSAEQSSQKAASTEQGEKPTDTRKKSKET